MSENRQVADDRALLGAVWELRTDLSDWQVYIEPRFAWFTLAGTMVDPVDLAKGAQLAATITAQTNALTQSLRSAQLADAAARVTSATAGLSQAITALGPLATGRPASAILAGVTKERTAFARVWTDTAAVAAQLADIEERDLREASDHLDNGRIVLLILGSTAGIASLVGALVLGERARRRERIARDVTESQAFETVLMKALDMSRSEPDVYAVLGRAIAQAVPDLQVEMLLADSSRAHFRRTLTTAAAADRRDGCGVVSPLDCPAAIRGHSLEAATSRALDACPHLQGRATGECSAVCVPVSIGGKTVGVVHATGSDGVPPKPSEVRYLEVASRRGSERLAMLRAFEKSETQARSDPLTGLLNRRSLENNVHDLRREGVPYVLAYGDLDHFKLLNDTHGHEAGDQALRLFARVMRDSVRPDDLVARYGGEEFVIVLPDCGLDAAVAVLERVRERLALALTSGRVPPFTVSFGVASSTNHDSFDAAVARADDALLEAKAAGRNRVLVADEALVGPDLDTAAAERPELPSTEPEP